LIDKDGSDRLSQFSEEERRMYQEKREAVERWKTGESDPVYLTMMREPIARSVSYYLYHHAKVKDSAHIQTIDCDMVCYLNRTENANNLMTAMISGAFSSYWNDDDPSIEPLPNMLKDRSNVFETYVVKRNHYLLARRHLIGMIVGLQERFSDSLEHFRFFTELSMPMHQSNMYINSISALNPTYKLTSEDLIAAEAINQWDIELYKLCQRLFEQQHKIFLSF